MAWNVKKCMVRKIRAKCKFIGLRNDRLRCKCEEGGNKSSKLPKEAIKNFPILYQLCKCDLNNFFLSLRKGYYPYEEEDSWEKYDETTMPPKEAFYSELILEGINDTKYADAQKVWEVFEIKNFGEYHNLYAQSGTLLLPDVFENFRNMCLNEYGLDPANFWLEQG